MNLLFPLSNLCPHCNQLLQDEESILYYKKICKRNDIIVSNELSWQLINFEAVFSKKTFKLCRVSIKVNDKYLEYFLDPRVKLINKNHKFCDINQINGDTTKTVIETDEYIDLFITPEKLEEKIKVIQLLT